MHDALHGIADEITEPHPLPASWHQSGVHVGECRTLGLYGNAIARDFRKWAEGRERSNWDSTFTALVRYLADGAVRSDSGFGDFEDFSVYVGLDDWAERYRMDFYNARSHQRMPEQRSERSERGLGLVTPADT